MLGPGAISRGFQLKDCVYFISRYSILPQVLLLELDNGRQWYLCVCAPREISVLQEIDTLPA